MRFARALVAAVVVIGVSAVGTRAWAGNADAAHACQRGGYQNVTRQDGTPFRNPGACTSYVARGGVLRPRHTWNGVVTATSQPGQALFSTLLQVDGTGFTPDTAVTVVLSYPPAGLKPGVGGHPEERLGAETDRRGDVSVAHERPCAFDLAPVTVTITETADPTRTASTTLADVRCSRDYVWNGQITVASSPVEWNQTAITVHGTGFTPRSVPSVMLHPSTGRDTVVSAVTDAAGAFETTVVTTCVGMAPPVTVSVSDPGGTVAEVIETLACGGEPVLPPFVHGEPSWEAPGSMDVVFGRFTPNVSLQLVISAVRGEPGMTVLTTTDADGGGRLTVDIGCLTSVEIIATEVADASRTATGPGDTSC